MTAHLKKQRYFLGCGFCAENNTLLCLDEMRKLTHLTVGTHCRTTVKCMRCKRKLIGDWGCQRDKVIWDFGALIDNDNFLNRVSFYACQLK